MLNALPISDRLEPTIMMTQQQKEFKRKAKQYLQDIARINPSTVSIFWSDAIDKVLINLPSEVEDQAIWGPFCWAGISVIWLKKRLRKRFFKRPFPNTDVRFKRSR